MVVKTYSIKNDGKTKLLDNFTVIEFRCKDGSDKVLIDLDTVSFLQKIRDRFGKPISITSAYRSPAYNKKIGGASNSKHVQGMAVDFYISGVDVKDIASYAESIGCLGIGCYTRQKFVHIDSRKTKYFWINDGMSNASERAVATHGGAVKQAEEDEEMIYNKISEVPSWGQPTVNKLIKLGALKGGTAGLNLNETMLRIFVVLDRLGKLD